MGGASSKRKYLHIFIQVYYHAWFLGHPPTFGNRLGSTISHTFLLLHLLFRDGSDPNDFVRYLNGSGIRMSGIWMFTVFKNTGN